MANPPITELSTRAREIFRLVVEGYLSSGQPVGSKTLAGGGAVNLSPASIRSVLHELEQRGLLAAPHRFRNQLVGQNQSCVGDVFHHQQDVGIFARAYVIPM